MGMHRQYQTVEELQSVIDAYFAECLAMEMHPTVTGLAYALDLTRQGLINYAERSEFVDTIKRAKIRVEIAVEQTLMNGKSTAGAIFNLKNNFGWLDEKIHNQNIQGSIGVTGTRVVFKDSDGSNAEGL